MNNLRKKKNSNAIHVYNFTNIISKIYGCPVVGTLDSREDSCGLKYCFFFFKTSDGQSASPDLKVGSATNNNHFSRRDVKRTRDFTFEF